jgi:hypothetical protein
MKAAFSRVFTLEVDGRPTLALKRAAPDRPNRSARKRGFSRI